MTRTIADRAQIQGKEIRTSTGIEIRSSDASGFTFDGIASMVDTPYSVNDWYGEYTETITRGAFNRTLKSNADVRLLINHDGIPLARSSSGTLKLTANPHLRAIAELDPVAPRVQDITSAMNRGDINQMSIAFRVNKNDQEWNADYTERTIHHVALSDVSLVTYPASPTTSAQLRSMDEILNDLTGVELSEDEIRRAIAHFNGLLPTDEFSERDRQDRDRLARIVANRPAFVF